ncbi:MAG: tRNA pseudouridine(38-40) synthase TruA [Anaerolineales bacterium]|nr:tRNA pseudouridine(38-40) synthase TruA [Anaerolineales bacterium]
MLIYKSNIAYDGTEFQGFQSQREKRTVQDVLEEGLRRIGWQGSRIKAAGRTDQGVHARGQVISYEMDWPHGVERLTDALNANIPPDVAVWQTAEADEGFHPRFSAVSRRYRYHILCSPYRNPLQERYTWRVWPAPDISLMQDAATLLLGEHDFAAFGRPPIPGGHTIRMVFQADWLQENQKIQLDITANAFLYHMVRRLVAMMVAVGSSRLDVSGVADLLDKPDSRWEGSLAPASGLCLEEVCYQETVNTEY